MQKSYGLEFRSNSDEIKHYIRECLKDKKPHFRQDIIAYVKEKTGNTTYTRGQMAGSFQSISEEQGYESPRQAVYQYVGVVNTDQSISDNNVSSTADACKVILDKAIKDLKAKVEADDIAKKTYLELAPEELAELKRLSNFIKELEAIKI